MVAPINIYFEGNWELREGFRQFFNSLAVTRRPKLISCGGREKAIGDFFTAWNAQPDEHHFLLIDSEGPFSGHLFDRICKSLPGSAKPQVFWMVQAMEAWFLADMEALQAYYKGKLHARGLTGKPETIGKPKDKLKAAVRHCGRYDEVTDASVLLRKIRPQLVRDACPRCAEIFEQIPFIARTRPKTHRAR